MNNTFDQLRNWEVKKIVLENTESEERIQEMIDFLDIRVVWQEQAKRNLVDWFFKSINTLNKSEHPLFIALLSWPTWVGKSEVCKAFAEYLLWSADRLVRINGELLQDSHAKTNLIGSPRSYVWYWEKTILSAKSVYKWYEEAMKDNSINENIKHLPQSSIIVIEEIDKIHQQVKQAFLWMFDNWLLELSNWEVVNFRNSIILMTSNLWQAEISAEHDRPMMWFVNTTDKKRDAKNIEKDAIKKWFSPEFLWRIDKEISFDRLSNEELEKIVHLNINKLKTDLKKLYKNISGLNVHKKVITYILEESDSDSKGARDLVRTFNRLLRYPLAQVIQSNWLWEHWRLSFRINAELVKWEIEFSLWSGSIEDVEDTTKHEIAEILTWCEEDEERKNIIQGSLMMWIVQDIKEIWDKIWFGLNGDWTFMKFNATWIWHKEWVEIFQKDFDKIWEEGMHDLEDIKYMLYADFLDKVWNWMQVMSILVRDLRMSQENIIDTFWEKYEEFYRPGIKPQVMSRRLKIWYNNSGK